MPRASTKVENAFNRPFAVRLRALLENHHISQKDLSERIGVTRQAINAYALGTTVPDIDRLVQIADFFNVSYDYLLGKTLSERRENIDIANELGLSDAAIATIRLMRLKSSSDHKKCDRVSALDILNYFLELEKSYWEPDENIDPPYPLGLFETLKFYYSVPEYQKDVLFLTRTGELLDFKEIRKVRDAFICEIPVSKATDAVFIDQIVDRVRHHKITFWDDRPTGKESYEEYVQQYPLGILNGPMVEEADIDRESGEIDNGEHTKD